MRSRASHSPFARRQRVFRSSGPGAQSRIAVSRPAVTRAFAVAFAVVALAAPTVARAASVTVHLDVSALEPFASAPIASCAVSVAENADGVAVLAAAERSGCIDSYETRQFSYGTFVECINAICGTPATYWRMTENGMLTSYGVDGFKAANGDVLGLSYTTFAGCFVGEDLC